MRLKSIFWALTLAIVIPVSTASSQGYGISEEQILELYPGMKITPITEFSEYGFEYLIDGKYHNPMGESNLASLYEVALNLKLNELERSGTHKFEINRIQQEHLAHIKTIRSGPFGQNKLPRLIKAQARFEFSDDDYDFDKQVFNICMEMDGDGLNWRNSWGFQSASNSMPFSKNGIEFDPQVVFELSSTKTCYPIPVPLDKAEKFFEMSESFGNKSGYRGHVWLTPDSIRILSYDFKKGAYPKIYLKVFNIQIDDSSVFE